MGGRWCGRGAGSVCAACSFYLINMSDRQSDRRAKGRGSPHSCEAKPCCQPVGKVRVLTAHLHLRPWPAWTRSHMPQLGPFNAFTAPDSRQQSFQWKENHCSTLECGRLGFTALRQNVFQAPKRLQECFAPLNQVVTPSRLSPYLISCVQPAVTQTSV